jgi:hypothetical protein
VWFSGAPVGQVLNYCSASCRWLCFNDIFIPVLRLKGTFGWVVVRQWRLCWLGFKLLYYPTHSPAETGSDIFIPVLGLMSNLVGVSFSSGGSVAPLSARFQTTLLSYTCGSDIFIPVLRLNVFFGWIVLCQWLCSGASVS